MTQKTKAAAILAGQAAKHAAGAEFAELENVLRQAKAEGLTREFFESLLPQVQAAGAAEDLLLSRLGVAAIRAGEIDPQSGRRICACLVMALTPESAEPVRHGAPIPWEQESRARLEKRGILLADRYVGLEQAAAWGFEETIDAHKALMDGLPPASAPKRKGPGQSSGDAQAKPGIVLFSLQGAQSELDDPDSELARLACESVSETLAKCDGVFPVRAGFLNALVSRSEELLLPFACAMLVKKVSKMAWTEPKDIAVSLSFHASEEPDGQEEEPETLLARFCARGKQTGFTLDGMQMRISGACREEAVEAIGRALTPLGVEQLYVIDHVFGPELCPECSKPLYPMPAVDLWVACAKDSGMPADGSHIH